MKAEKMRPKLGKFKDLERTDNSKKNKPIRGKKKEYQEEEQKLIYYVKNVQQIFF